jgi:hypothetical protein
MYVPGIGWEGMECIHLAQYGDQWKALVNLAVMNLLVPRSAGNLPG